MAIEMRARIYDTNSFAVIDVNSNIETYERIIVLLDGSPAAERAISTAIELVGKNEPEIILICSSHIGARNYIHAKTTALQHQRFNARGYVVSGSLSNLPAWILKTEQADAIVVPQKPVGWLGRLIGEDIAARLSERTGADILTVAV